MSKLIKEGLIFLGILLVSLILFDQIFIRLDLFSPPKDQIGNEHVGFSFHLKQVGKENLGQQKSYLPRFKGKKGEIIKTNEWDCRSSRSIKEILSKPFPNLILVLGDSHTDLPYGNELTHPFILEHELKNMGVNSTEVFNAGYSRFSPLQCYLLYKYYLRKLNPRVIIFNLYIGNDFYDLFRIDDRPYLAKDANGNYKIHSPVWIKYRDPALQGGSMQDSRVLFVLKKILQKADLWGNWMRVRYLLNTAREQNQGIGSIFKYMWDIKRSVEPSLWYPGAYSAQILNQQIFFKYFPKSKEESLSRLSFLLKMIKDENPDIKLVLSPIPSATLSGALKGSSVFQNKINQLGLTYSEIVESEQELFNRCREIAGEQGWIFVDLLSSFRAYPEPKVLFMKQDLHISPEASRLIGEEEAKAMMPLIREMQKSP